LSCSCVIATAYIIVFLNEINGDGDDLNRNFVLRLSSVSELENNAHTALYTVIVLVILSK